MWIFHFRVESTVRPCRSPGQVLLSGIGAGTREADDALALVKTGVIRGFSIEFRASRETMRSGVRVIQAATVCMSAAVPIRVPRGRGRDRYSGPEKPENWPRASRRR